MLPDQWEWLAAQPGGASFAADLEAFGGRIERWPADVRAHLLRLADPDYEGSSGARQG